MIRLLLTGSNGFIGSYFLDKYNSDYFIERFSYLTDDLEQLVFIKIDTVVHLAAIVHQIKGAPEEAYQKINVEYPLLLAQKAKVSGVKQFVFMSSVKVYGEESKTAYSEKTLCHPKDPYGKSKLQAEKALLALEDEDFKVSIIRTPLVYGEGVKANILNLIKLIDRFPILPFGEINNKRSMAYVGNLVHMISEIIKQKKSGIFLASDDKQISTSRLISTIARKLEKRIWLFPCYLFRYFLKWFKPLLYQRLYADLYIDNKKSKTKLNLSNPYSFDEGIKKTVIWYKANRN